MKRRSSGQVAAGLVLLLLNARAFAAPPPAPSPPATASESKSQFRIAPVDDEWRNSLPRDATRATQAYLDRLPLEVVARSNHYYEGGYWLQLLNFLAGLAVAFVMLRGKRSVRVRDWAHRVARKPLLGDALYGGIYFAAADLLALPLTVYQEFVREHSYGMATQGFTGWAVDHLIEVTANSLLMAIAVAVLYAVLRRAGDRWWLWGTVTVTSLLALILLVKPIWLDPQAARRRKSEVHDIPDNPQIALDESRQHVLATDMANAMRRLTEGEQLALLHCYHLDLTHEDAAYVLGIPVGTVKTNIARRKAKLREYLAAWNPTAKS